MYPRMNKYNDNIWIGCFEDGTDVEKLRENGITAIANLTGHSANMARRGFKEIVVPQEDGDFIPETRLMDFLDWMSERDREKTWS